MATFKVKSCEHLDEVSEVKQAKVYECETCIQTGDTWIHLRTCQTCGITLCCDSSLNKHASKQDCSIWVHTLGQNLALRKAAATKLDWAVNPLQPTPRQLG